jgi:catechol 2,3-dioxygenase-like lactoylglutathione lyase family enzyme
MNDGPVVEVTAFDHLVLRCADVEVTLAWYVDVLGLEPVRVDEWRREAAPFPSVRVSPDTIIDLIPGGSPPSPTVAAEGESSESLEPSAAAGGLPRLDHLGLLLEPPDLEAPAESRPSHVVDGPSVRFGARGLGTSLYVLDPDGLTVELRHY